MEAFSSYNAHADVYIFNSPHTVDPVFPAYSKVCDIRTLYKDESF